MSIDPMKSGSANPSGPRIDQAANQAASRVSGQSPKVTPDAREAEAADDSVQLSARAREAGSTGAASASGLSAERLQEILDRVAARVKDDLTGSTPVA
jgi:hypothetical protein